MTKKRVLTEEQKARKRAYNAAYRQANRELLRAKHAEYVALNLDKVRQGKTRWRIENPEKKRAASEAWDAKNPEKVKAKFARYKRKHRESIQAYMTKYREENKEKLKEYQLSYDSGRRESQRLRQAKRRTENPHTVIQYKAANRHKITALAAKRRATKKLATPSWANHDKIKEFYFAANFLSMVTGQWYHVDHIVPLAGRIVCGLHSESNLQVIPGPDNLSKGNSYWPDMP